MKVFESDVEVGDAVAIGGLSVFPLTSVKVDGREIVKTCG